MRRSFSLRQTVRNWRGELTTSSESLTPIMKSSSGSAPPSLPPPRAAPTFGGVPAIDPPRLDDPDAIADPLNDFGCRFIDGQGNTVGRICQLGCVRFESGDYGCQMGDNTEIQFCAPVSMPLTFPSGDTLVTARVRDQAGNLGAPAQLLVRVTPQ